MWWSLTLVGAAYSNNGKFLAIGDIDGVIRVHVRAKIGTASAKFHRVDIPSDYPTALAFTPDSTLLIVATSISKHIQFYTISSKCVVACCGGGQLLCGKMGSPS